jgi:hypothetical protein
MQKVFLRSVRNIYLFEIAKGKGKVKRKAIPITGHEAQQSCETSRVPHYLDNRLTDGSEVVSLTRRPPFTPQEDSWY